MTAARVLLGAISLTAGAGGIARLARLMAKVVAEECQAGHLEARVLSLYGNEVPVELGLPVWLAHNSKLRYSLKAMQDGWECSHCLFDACHMAQVHSLPCLRRRPMMTFMCGIEVWENTNARYLHSLRRASHLLAISEYTRDRADRLHGGFARARICWLATESDEPFPRNEKPRAGPPEALIVSRLERERYKGHRELIECWHRVVGAVPEATLRIVGQGPDLGFLKQLAAASPVTHRIVFQGFVSDEELDQLYSQASVFTMPSRGEGFGLVYVEAMRHGLPVIASVHDAAPEIVIDGKTGYTVNLDLPDQLPERMICLLKDPEQARQFGEAGRDRWQEHFRFSTFRNRFKPLLREFLSYRR